MAIMSAMLYGFSAGHQRSQRNLCARQSPENLPGAADLRERFRGTLPQNTNAQTSEAVLDELVPKYTADTSIFICPGGRDSQIPSGEPLRQIQNQLRLLTWAGGWMCRKIR